MSINNKKKLKSSKSYKKKNSIPKVRRLWGFILFLVSLILLPLIFSLSYLYYKNKGYTLKSYWFAYKKDLISMLKGNWSEY